MNVPDLLAYLPAPQANWKTTVAGIAAGLLNAWAGGGLNLDNPDFKALLASAAIAALGWLAKDAGVTGTAK